VSWKAIGQPTVRKQRDVVFDRTRRRLRRLSVGSGVGRVARSREGHRRAGDPPASLCRSGDRRPATNRCRHRQVVLTVTLVANTWRGDLTVRTID
jgi:hypothetical protein